MKEIITALLAAQKEMGTAKKGSANPFFKSKYADINAIREACIPVLNSHDIVVLQPTVHIDGRNFVKTILMHTSGETIEGLTEILFIKVNDAQAQGGGITYARRYGLQSLVNIGADDDDGTAANAAPQPIKKAIAKPAKAPVPAPEPELRIEVSEADAQLLVSNCKTLKELAKTFGTLHPNNQKHVEILKNDLKTTLK